MVALLTLVHLQVLHEVVVSNETVPTEAALKRFGPRVCPMVRLPVPPQGEGLVAVEALVGLLAAVDLLVDDEAEQRGVGLPTLPALVGCLALVDPLMSLQVGQFVEAPLTLGAVDHLSACVGGELLPHWEVAKLGVIVCKTAKVKGHVKTGTVLFLFQSQQNTWRCNFPGENGVVRIPHTTTPYQHLH